MRPISCKTTNYAADGSTDQSSRACFYTYRCAKKSARLKTQPCASPSTCLSDALSGYML